MSRHWILTTSITVFTALAAQIATAAAPVTSASDLIGRTVETRDGEELGQVRDFALDLDDGSIRYVIVSVGSFLIQDGLIAVDLGALRESADADGRLVLETDPQTLRAAQRFGRGDLPQTADVTASPAAPPSSSSGDAEAATATGDLPDAGRGTATISDGNRTATLSAGERSIRFDGAADATTTPQAEAPVRNFDGDPDTLFMRLDRDGDGVLNRAEIAHQLSPTDRYSDIDLDASGAIDPGEFGMLVAGRSSGAE